MITFLMFVFLVLFPLLLSIYNLLLQKLYFLHHFHYHWWSPHYNFFRDEGNLKIQLWWFGRLEQWLWNLQRQQSCWDPGLNPARDYNIHCSKLERISCYSFSMAPGNLWPLTLSNRGSAYQHTQCVEYCNSSNIDMA